MDVPQPGIICRRYLAFHDYLLSLEPQRRLTPEERRAFMHLLDMEDTELHPGWSHFDECECSDIMPRIVQALDPDPVNGVLAERDMNDITDGRGRGYKALLPANQGITLTPKIKADHAESLVSCAKETICDLEVLIAELKSRADLLGFANGRELMREVFPELLELVDRTIASNGNGFHTVGLRQRRNMAIRTSSPRGKVQAALAAWHTVPEVADLTGLPLEKVESIISFSDLRLLVQVRQRDGEEWYRMKGA